MLEVTNIRNGAILNHARGTETDDYLEIKVEGIADPQAIVKVNGADVERADRFFLKSAEFINCVVQFRA